MNLDCYHTLEDRENPDYIDKWGPFECTRGDFWFGKGYYFWDTNIEWAHNWGKGSYKDAGYVICRALITLDEKIFDLTGNVKHKMAFIEAYNVIMQRQPPKNRKIVLRDVIYYMQKTGSFPFNGIRGEHEHDRALTVRFNNDKQEYVRLGNPVQICLINRNNILSQTFRIVFPEKYV